MSSNEDEYNDGDTSSRLLQKKRRMQRACDICRRKKIRCDGVQIPGNPCSNCMSSRLVCTYMEEAKKRSPPKGSVQDLENKVEKLEKLVKLEKLERLEKLLRRLCPDEEVYNQLIASVDSNWAIDRPPVDPSALVGDIASKAPPNIATLGTVTSAIRGAVEDKSDNTSSDSQNDDDDPTLTLTDNLKRLALSPKNDSRFLGKSSWGTLVETAIELRKEYTGDGGRFNDLLNPVLEHQRTEFWCIRPWESNSEATPSPKYNFPDLDLALHCIDLYFLHSNLYLPLLHRPTFDKSVKEGLHLTNDNFAPVFLLVCAVGARHSDNPRVRVDGFDSHISAGWKWFEQVQIMKRSILAPPTLYDLQLHCLCILYLQGTSSPQSCWTLAGIGIRLAQDVGVHRRKAHGHTLTINDELWKRAFWVLVCSDRITSSTLGRPCAIHDEDFDLDLPVDCDDEYWDHPDPEKRFKQPPNKPSLVRSFILTIKLHQVLAYSLRTIYSLNKSKILLGFVGEQWEQHIVAELDSALNKWVDSVPDHLRWDPHREDDNFFNQSVFIYAAYYHIQIIIHRPFIALPSKPSPLSFPSLAICTNAARSCSHVVDIHRKRNRFSLPLTQLPVFSSGVVLLLSIWGGKRSGLFMDPNKEMVDVHKCMEVLKASEVRWNHAGRLWDILYEFACVGKLPLPQSSPPSMKREREWDSASSSNASELTSSPKSHSERLPRVIAGSRRVHKEPSFIKQPQQVQTPQSRSHIQPSESQPTTSPVPPFNNTDLNVPESALPVYNNDLGRLPPHGQMTFSAQAHLSQPQTHPSQLDRETNYWYTASHPTTHSDASGASSSYAPHYPPAPASQQQPYPHHHAPRGIPEREFPSAPEASSAALGDAELATGMVFDAIGERAGYTQQRASTYGLGPMHSSLPGMGSGSMVSTPPQSSSSSSMEDVYRRRRMGMETMPDRLGGHSQRQHQTVPRQQEQRASSYPFVFDNDALAAWSNAPTGFELDEWSTFLSSFGELTQENVQDHSGGQYQQQPQQQRVPQQHEQQPSSYPLIIDNDRDIRSNAPTVFELDNGVPSLPTSVS